MAKLIMRIASDRLINLNPTTHCGRNELVMRTLEKSGEKIEVNSTPEKMAVAAVLLITENLWSHATGEM